MLYKHLVTFLLNADRKEPGGESCNGGPMGIGFVAPSCLCTSGGSKAFWERIAARDEHQRDYLQGVASNACSNLSQKAVFLQSSNFGRLANSIFMLINMIARASRDKDSFRGVVLPPYLTEQVQGIIDLEQAFEDVACIIPSGTGREVFVEGGGQTYYNWASKNTGEPGKFAAFAAMRIFASVSRRVRDAADRFVSEKLSLNGKEEYFAVHKRSLERTCEGTWRRLYDRDSELAECYMPASHVQKYLDLSGLPSMQSLPRACLRIRVLLRLIFRSIREAVWLILHFQAYTA